MKTPNESDGSNGEAVDRTSWLVHVVMIDEDLRTAFITGDPAKSDEARRLLVSAFGEDRVSVRRYAESSLDEYRSAVALWRDDPRIGPAPHEG